MNLQANTKTQLLVIHHLNQLITMDEEYCAPGNPLGIIEDGAIIAQEGRIRWMGPSSAIDAALLKQATVVDGRDKILTPGLIDSHTHAIFAGDRATEFEARLCGKTYLEIAQDGGGILNTVQATRAASPETLAELTCERLNRMMTFGVTTAEVKTGYGLSLESELKCLRVLKALSTSHPISIVPTFMGAHDIPAEFRHKPERYVEILCHEMLPVVAAEKLAVFCDVFCEEGYFSLSQSRRILETAQRFGFKLKIHAEEFADIGGAVLAGELQATSADHLLHISENGIHALKYGGTVATLLPGTAFYLRVPYAPAKALLEAGVPVALATDFNPGSCMTENLQMIMSLGCIQMQMTPAEVMYAVTVNAAKAVGLEHDRGSLTLGKRADFVLFDCPSYQELFYHFGINRVEQVYIAAQRVVG